MAVVETIEETEPKQIRRTNSGRVIVFDPVKQILTTEKAKNLNSRLYFPFIWPENCTNHFCSRKGDQQGGCSEMEQPHQHLRKIGHETHDCNPQSGQAWLDRKHDATLRIYQGHLRYGALTKRRLYLVRRHSFPSGVSVISLETLQELVLFFLPWILWRSCSHVPNLGRTISAILFFSMSPHRLDILSHGWTFNTLVQFWDLQGLILAFSNVLAIFNVLALLVWGRCFDISGKFTLRSNALTVWVLVWYHQCHKYIPDEQLALALGSQYSSTFRTLAGSPWCPLDHSTRFICREPVCQKVRVWKMGIWLTLPRQWYGDFQGCLVDTGVNTNNDICVWWRSNCCQPLQLQRKTDLLTLPSADRW